MTDRINPLALPLRSLPTGFKAMFYVTLAVTIIGIPLAIANLKLIPVSLVPLGREIVDSDDVTTHGSQPNPLR